MAISRCVFTRWMQQSPRFPEETFLLFVITFLDAAGGLLPYPGTRPGCGETCHSGHNNLFQLPVHIRTDRGGHPVSVDDIVFRNLAVRVQVEERIPFH